VGRQPGCIDLNPWYATSENPSTPDYLHFDLDPGEGVPFGQVRESALLVRKTLVALGMKPLLKTNGSRGMHLYVPIVRGPDQKVVGPPRRCWLMTSRGAIRR
jgi:bifunctional non-homologous end joining protein LigD